jgi:hypothetical protein
VVTQKEIERFISSQPLHRAQLTARRFAVVADAAKAIGRGEDVELNWRLIRRIADEDKSADYQRIMGTMIKAIEQGEEGIAAAYSTAMHLKDFGFEYAACDNRERTYKEALEQVRRAAKAS